MFAQSYIITTSFYGDEFIINVKLRTGKQVFQKDNFYNIKYKNTIFLKTEKEEQLKHFSEESRNYRVCENFRIGI